MSPIIELHAAPSESYFHVAGMRPFNNSPLVTRLQRANGIVLGKTRMHELAFGGSTIAPGFHTVLNPVSTPAAAPQCMRSEQPYAAIMQAACRVKQLPSRRPGTHQAQLTQHLSAVQQPVPLWREQRGHCIGHCSALSGCWLLLGH